MADPRSARLGGGLLAVLFTFPLLALVVRAFADDWRAPNLLPQRFGWRGFEVAFVGAGADRAFVTSLVVAVVATGLAVLVGWPAARALGGRRLRHPGPVFLLLALPLLIPPYAAGVGLSEWFIRLGLSGTVVGLVLVHLLLVLPYVVVVLLSGFGPQLTALEEMARMYGAGAPRRLASVTLPSIAPTLAAASLLGFLVSWSQYGSSLAVGAGRPMLPLLMLPFIHSDPQVAAAFALLFLLPAVLALLVATRLSRSPL